MTSIDTWETFFSVNASVDVLAPIVGSSIERAVDERGPVSFVDKNDGPVRFTLFSFDAEPSWTHVLSSDPEDIDSIADFISKLGVPVDALGVAWDDEFGEPLRDVEPLRARVIGVNRTRH